MKSPLAAPQPTLRSQAIKLLARREHSRAELSKKLALKSAAATPEDIAQLLDQLEAAGLLSDLRAATAYVRSHAARFGTARLSQRLRARGIDSALIEASLAQDEIADEQARAAAIWRRKFAGPPHDAREWARQARFLQGRGFSTDIIRRILILKGAPGDDHD